jgi:AcrR family transcriptional regulator
MAFLPQVDIRRNILDITRKLLIEQGITRLSIRMIAREVGCSVGTIYFYFENKDVLIHALIEEGFDKLIQIQKEAETSISDPLQRLEALCRNYILFALENPEYYEIMFMLKPERMARYPAEKYRRARHSLEVLATALSQCTEKGLMNVAEPYLESHLIWAFMHGIVSLIQVKRIDRRIKQDEIINAAIKQIIEMDLINHSQSGSE